MSNLKAIKRENTSSGSNNKLRSEGLIPAILYGGKDANKNISIEKKDIKSLIHSDTPVVSPFDIHPKVFFQEHLLTHLYGPRWLQRQPQCQRL